MQLPLETLSAKAESLRVPAALKLKCREQLARLHDALLGKGFAWPMPTVSFELRGRTAGQALWPSNHVRLNAVLLVENPDAFLEGVIGHELAHLATHARYGVAVKAHGPQWQSVMRLLGLKPSRCHTLDTRRAAVSKPTHRYICACAEPHWLTPRRHGIARKRDYVCRRCRQVLRHAPQGARPGMALPEAREGATAPSTHAVRPPTPAMLGYAQGLARRLGVPLPPGATEGFEACRAFIEAARSGRLAPPEGVTAAAPVPTGSAVIAEHVPTSPAKPMAAPPATPPSEGQLRFAKGLAARLGIVVPGSVLGCRRALSAWLDEQGERLSRG